MSPANQGTRVPRVASKLLFLPEGSGPEKDSSTQDISGARAAEPNVPRTAGSTECPGAQPDPPAATATEGSGGH